MTDAISVAYQAVKKLKDAKVISRTAGLASDAIGKVKQGAEYVGFGRHRKVGRPKNKKKK